MAQQNEAKDPAAAALLAIEEALNLVKVETPAAPDATPAGPEAGGRDRRRSGHRAQRRRPRRDLKAPEIRAG